MVDRVIQWFGSVRFGVVLDAALVAIASLGASPAFAQMRSFECATPGDIPISKAETIVAKVQSSYSEVDFLHGAFRQESYLAALEASEASSGDMWFGRPGAMRWVYKEPKPQVVVIKDGTLWLYQIDKRQVLIDKVGEVLVSDLPISFMMGLGNLSRDFELQGACHSADGVVLSLVPRLKPADSSDPRPDSAKEAARAELAGFDLLVGEEGGLPRGARVTSIGGNITAILFEKLASKGLKPPAGTFVLEYPNSVDVMDRRVKSAS